MKLSGWTFYPHILRSLIFSLILILICMPVVTFLEKLINNWFSFFAVCILGEGIGLVLYFSIVCSAEERNQIKKGIVKYMKKIKEMRYHYD